MSLEERLDSDLLAATRNSDLTAKLAIRSVKAAMLEARVAGKEARSLTDQDVQTIIARQIKQRRDSIAEYQRGQRQDLIAQEEAEIKVLEAYLPRQLDEAAVREHATAVIAELGVSDMKGMGPVMKRMSADLRGQADGALINRVVRELLA